MNQSAGKSILEEIKSFPVLEEKVRQLIGRLTSLKDERDTLVKQLMELEGHLQEHQTEVTGLREKLRDPSRGTLDSDKSEIIKKRLNGILDKLEEFS